MKKFQLGCSAPGLVYNPRMKHTILSLLLALLSPAFAGVGGHGGGGLIKVEQASSPTEVLLLDLWEGATEQNLVIPQADAPVEQQALRAIEKLTFFHPVLGKDLSLAYEHVKTRVKWVTGRALTPPGDTTRDYLEEGYYLVGVANYNDATDTLEVSQKYFRLMSPTHQAALYVHEALYLVLRTSGTVTDSRLVRSLVARAFSTEPLHPVFTSLESSVLCGSEDGQNVGVLSVEGPAVEFKVVRLNKHYLTRPLSFLATGPALGRLAENMNSPTSPQSPLLRSLRATNFVEATHKPAGLRYSVHRLRVDAHGVSYEPANHFWVYSRDAVELGQAFGPRFVAKKGARGKWFLTLDFSFRLPDHRDVLRFSCLPLR